MRCKQGDDAIVIRSPTGENIGCFVKIVKAFGIGRPNMLNAGKFCWVVERKDGQSLVGRSVLKKTIASVKQIICADGDLQPIRGLPISNNDEDQIPCEA